MYHFFRRSGLLRWRIGRAEMKSNNRWQCGVSLWFRQQPQQVNCMNAWRHASTIWATACDVLYRQTLRLNKNYHINVLYSKATQRKIRELYYPRYLEVIRKWFMVLAYRLFTSSPFGTTRIGVFVGEDQLISCSYRWVNFSECIKAASFRIIIIIIWFTIVLNKLTTESTSLIFRFSKVNDWVPTMYLGIESHNSTLHTHQYWKIYRTR